MFNEAISEWVPGKKAFMNESKLALLIFGSPFSGMGSKGLPVKLLIVLAMGNSKSHAVTTRPIRSRGGDHFRLLCLYSMIGPSIRWQFTSGCLLMPLICGSGLKMGNPSALAALMIIRSADAWFTVTVSWSVFCIADACSRVLALRTCVINCTNCSPA